MENYKLKPCNSCKELVIYCKCCKKTICPDCNRKEKEQRKEGIFSWDGAYDFYIKLKDLNY